jgi:ketosteroid isomerase-like protein
MSEPKPLTVARAYHQAWSTRDLENVGRYLADDLVVEVPINTYAGKTDFLDAVQRTAQRTSKVRLLAELGGVDEAMLLYDMTLPIGELRVAEHFTISGGKILKVRQIHDTAALRAAGMGRQ